MLLFVGVHWLKVESSRLSHCKPMDWAYNLVFSEHVAPQIRVMIRKARCTGIVRYAVLCPCAKDTCSCYAYCEVARPILSQPRRTCLPRKAGANPGKRFPLSVVSACVPRPIFPS